MNTIDDSKFSPTSDYRKIPLEAVKSVDRKALMCSRLSEVLSAAVASKGTETVAADDWSLRLFEQAAAAGKITEGNDDNSADRSVVKPNFASGDSISVYVKYILNKTRKYLLDSDAAPRAAFKVGGITIDPASSSETSEEVFKTVEWKFTGVGAPPAAPGGGDANL
jgi:hypothetical protein